MIINLGTWGLCPRARFQFQRTHHALFTRECDPCAHANRSSWAIDQSTRWIGIAASLLQFPMICSRAERSYGVDLEDDHTGSCCVSDGMRWDPAMASGVRGDETPTDRRLKSSQVDLSFTIVNFVVRKIKKKKRYSFRPGLAPRRQKSSDGLGGL